MKIFQRIFTGQVLSAMQVSCLKATTNVVAVASRLPFALSIIAVVCCTQSKLSAQSDTVARGLQYVRDAGERWIDKRGCVSCHQVPSMIWAHEAAKRAGHDVSGELLEKWNRWSTDVVNFVKPEQKADCDPVATMASNIDTMTAMLLAIPPDGEAQWRKTFADQLVAEQAEDGSWKACGQLPLQNRPPLETHAATTLWTSLALLTENVAFQQDEAIAFADQVSDAKSIEWYAARLLVCDVVGDQRKQELQQRLLDLQNEDGGWGWIAEEPSDAFGTGLALYALSRVQTDPEPLNQARRYLTSTQTKSGRWSVPGTKKSAKGKPTATASDWGSAWAVIALAESE
ncbi:MAG: prenyltransferase/squalene oxidase repeat-containing protein [Pirellulaceae bacterium]